MAKIVQNPETQKVMQWIAGIMLSKDYPFNKIQSIKEALPPWPAEYSYEKQILEAVSEPDGSNRAMLENVAAIIKQYTLDNGIILDEVPNPYGDDHFATPQQDDSNSIISSAYNTNNQ